MAAGSQASRTDLDRGFWRVPHRYLYWAEFLPPVPGHLPIRTSEGPIPDDHGIATVKLPAGSHYVELLLMAFAFFAVGQQRKVDAFKLLLLSIAGAVAFRTMRDAWFICIPAAACIADSLADEASSEPKETWLERIGVMWSVSMLLAVFAGSTDFSTRGLDRAISGFLPVNAVNYLRKNPAPGPLYNTLDWGGFFIWYMPNYPVAIDGRTDLYGDELEEQFFTTANGAPSYVSDPYLNQAGIVILQKTNGLVGVLESDPRFQMVYQDQQAAVFVRGGQQQSKPY